MKSIRPDLANDGEGTKSTNIQFAYKTRGVYVATQQPHFLAHHQIWSRTATLIGRAFYGLPGFFEFSLLNILSLPELVDIGVGCRGLGIRGWG